ncbi:SLC13 family permease [Coprobacter fastidiosus]|jgi:di/tricarboxylate transporter|uniref:SLC13 family permease n=1 Tax=Coprobacter fastidiosus TaxID=1099853 RepID=UPI001D552903|nr:SLC13 family permease [Coprobacter fastidiosus]HJF43040.1 SLC13 family permease [Coprobacter fastidiosus]
MYITLIILVLSAIFFMNGKIRSDVVALCALVLLLVFQILTPEEALSGFSNSIVIMMVGLFVVGGAIFQTGLAKMISAKILRMAGKSELKLFILVMLVTAAIGAFVSNTGTVALMLPIVVSLALSANMNASRLLMPLAFASSMGGMMTLIGTPPNLVIQNTLTENGYAPLSFFSFTPVGIICVLTGIIVLIPLSKIFLSKKGQNNNNKTNRNKSLNELVKEYQLADNLFRIKVNPKSPVIGKNVVELDIRKKYGLNVLEVRRISQSQSRFLKSVNQKLATDTTLQSEDVIYVMGDFNRIHQIAQELDLYIIDSHTTEESGKNKENSLDFYDIGIAEILLMPNSRLINQSVKDAGFRDKYNLNVLGIRRKKEYILHDIKDEKIHSGDVLLVQGTWNDIARLSEDQSEWVVLGQPLTEAAKVTLDYKAPVAAAIMVLMIAAMMFDFIPIAPVTAVMIAGLLMVLTGCFRNVESAYKTINWESIVLIAAMLPMSLALEKTGASKVISHSLVTGLGQYGPVILLAGVYFTTSLMTMFISNTATAVLLAPIAMQSAIGIGVSPYPFLFAVTVAASMCFASPFSTPPNALVMPAGQYTFMDYVKVGLPLQIIIGIIMIFTLPLIFPF